MKKSCMENRLEIFQKGLLKGAKWAREAFSFPALFSNVFTENVKLLQGPGKIIYSEKDEVIYLIKKM